MAQATCEREDERSKGFLLNFSYTLFISTDLGPLVLLVSGDQVLLTIGGGMGIEYLTSKWTLSNPPPPPEAVCSNVKPCSIFSYCCGIVEGFTCDRLLQRCAVHIYTLTVALTPKLTLICCVLLLHTCVKCCKVSNHSTVTLS